MTPCTTRLAIDVETTGLDPDRHHLLEFAVLLRRPDNGTTLYEIMRHRLLIPQDEMGEAFANCDPVNRDRLLRHVRDQYANASGFVSSYGANVQVHRLLRSAGEWGAVPVVGFNAEKLDIPFLHRAGVMPRTWVHHRTVQCGQLFMRPGDATLPDTQESCARALGAWNRWVEFWREDDVLRSQPQARRLKAFLESRAGADHDCVDDCYAAMDCYEVWEATHRE